MFLLRGDFRKRWVLRGGLTCKWGIPRHSRGLFSVPDPGSGGLEYGPERNRVVDCGEGFPPSREKVLLTLLRVTPNPL